MTPAALARIQGAGTDGFFAASVAEMKPSEVNYHLNRFLEDAFRFRFAADVYGFVALMNNAATAVHIQHADDQKALGYLEDIWVTRSEAEHRAFVIEFVSVS